MGQTLACTALAVAPQALNVFQFLPYVTLAGTGVWTLACAFTGMRAAHRLSGWRALLATLLPLVVLGLLAVLVFGVAGAVLSSVMAARMGGAQ